MANDRAQRTYRTAEVVLAFARHGVATDTISRALAIPSPHVEVLCRRAHEVGDISMMPPQKPTDMRTASLSELVHLREALSESQALVREMLAVKVDLVMAFHHVAGLTTKEATMVALLVKHGRLTKERLYHGVYGLAPDDEQPEPKIMDVFICKIRKKLEPHGITIGTLWGRGYEMDAKNCAAMRALAGVDVEVHDPNLYVPFMPSPSIVANDAVAL